VRDRLIAAIGRVAKAEAAAAGAPREPTVIVRDSNPPNVNDVGLVTRLGKSLRSTFGDANVVELTPQLTSDDVARYGREGVPTMKIIVGAVDPERWAQAKASNTALPDVHSPEWAPDRERTLRAGVSAFVTSALGVLGRP
jgi:hippurate hydrolase